MSTPSSDDTPSGAPSLDQPTTDEQSPPRFHERDPAAIAAEAGLGEPWPSEVAAVQDFYRQIFDFIDDKGWPDNPVGPLGDQWRGVGGAQSTYYLINVATGVRNLGLENRGQIVQIHIAISVGVGRRRRVVEELTIGIPG